MPEETHRSYKPLGKLEGRWVDKIAFPIIVITLAAIITGWLSEVGFVLAADTSMHLSRVRILRDRLPNAVLWNMWWYFGCPMNRFYAPLTHYALAAISWLFQLSLLDALKVYTWMVFALASLSVYLLARELELTGTQALISSFLFLTSCNLYKFWWCLGSFPHITGFSISLLSLMLFTRCLRKPTAFNMTAFGISVGLLGITHPRIVPFAEYLLVILGGIVFIRPELVLRAVGRPGTPQLTWTPVKILAVGLLVGFTVSGWWVLPALIEFRLSIGHSAIAPTLEAPKVTFVDQVANVFGVGNLLELSPGFAQVFLGIIGCLCTLLNLTDYKGRLIPLIIPLFITSFLVIVGASFGPPTPVLGVIPSPFFYAYGLGPYLSAFSAIVGSLAISYAASKYRTIKKRQLRRVVLVLLCALLLGAIMLPSINAHLTCLASIGPVVKRLEKPRTIAWIERHIEDGERVVGGANSYTLNLYSDLPQAEGCGLADMANEFAYDYWYYQISSVGIEPRFLPYFSRNFNVRYFLEPTGSMILERVREEGSEPIREVTEGVYEVEGFNSSFVEAVGASDILVLFVGDEGAYRNMFKAIALTNPRIVLTRIDALDELDELLLKSFDAVYLAGLRYRDRDRFIRLLDSYVRMGGGVILDTGGIGGRTISLPDLFPVTRVGAMNSSYSIAQNAQSEILKGINPAQLATNKTYTLSYAINLNADAQVILSDGDRPVLVGWKNRRAPIWTGLSLPFRVVLDLREDLSGLLVNLISYVAATTGRGTEAQASFKIINPGSIVIYVKNASPDDGIWVKMSYYPGWRAYSKGRELAILRGGPHMMLIFPAQTGEYEVVLRFEDSSAAWWGKATTLTGIVLLIICLWRRRKSRVRAKTLHHETAARAKGQGPPLPEP